MLTLGTRFVRHRMRRQPDLFLRDALMVGFVNGWRACERAAQRDARKAKASKKGARKR